MGAVKRGILAASRLAVMQRRMIHKARALSASGDATRAAEPSVAGTSDSKHWTQEMHKFSERTKHPILSVTNLRAKPDGAFLPPPGIDIHRKRAAPSEPLARKAWANVAFFDDSAPLPVVGVRVLDGMQRCHHADLVIVPDIRVLHDQTKMCENVGLAISALYILALGKDVTTAEAWKQAQGNPNKLAMSSVVPHVSASENKVTVNRSEAFAKRCPSVVNALRNIAAAPNSKWSQPLARLTKSKTEGFDTLADLMAWAVPLRRVARHGGPKVRAIDGTRLPA